MKISDNHIKKLQRFKKVKAEYDGSWMGTNPNHAFLISCGAGPWKWQRRERVQLDAIKWFMQNKFKDLSNVGKVSKVYPFPWQNNHLRCMVRSLKRKKISFKKQCKEWKIKDNEDKDFTCGQCEHWKNGDCEEDYETKASELIEDCEDFELKDSFAVSIAELFRMTGVGEKGTKVLWMFARDFLELPAFPIDRWVERSLDKYNLPKDAWYMTWACLKAGINPNTLNRHFFGADNPDFS